MGKKLDSESVIEIIKSKHPNKFTFDKFVYTGMNNKQTITCVTHGNSIKVVGRIIYGDNYGCNECSKEAMRAKFASDTKTFIRKARLIHGNQYSYRNTVYKNNRNNLKAFCRSCKKEVSINPHNHLLGRIHSGCVNNKNITIYFNCS